MKIKTIELGRLSNEAYYAFQTAVRRNYAEPATVKELVLNSF